ncbi:hypothetical protein BCF53_12249 [Reinekea marinisedimentorum]|uniref:Uncharacterized protein n=2 Tax=Reinekea marinisedimentorum TaxID=230495 RepID=A0A4R3HX76_9GAMM|nr:hypothetical protein BCF53_12249 [Reinekea marinisedimentorum]
MRLVYSGDWSSEGQIDFDGQAISVYAEASIPVTEASINDGKVLFKGAPPQFESLSTAAKHAFFWLSRLNKRHNVFLDKTTPNTTHLYANLDKQSVSPFRAAGDPRFPPNFRIFRNGIFSSRALIGEGKDCFSYYDLNWEEQWSFIGARNKPLMHLFDWVVEVQDNLIMNWTMERKSQQTSNGELRCLSTSGGSLIWSQVFPHQVDSIQKENEETVLVLSSSKLYRLNAKTGNIIAELNTGFANLVKSHYLFLADEFCFVVNTKERIALIVQLDNFCIVDTLDLAAHKLAFGNHSEPLKIGRNVHFRFNASGFQELIAEINLDTLDLTFEEEHQPSLQVTIPNEGYSPITIATDSEYIGDLLRYVEFTALELAEREGNEGRGLAHNKHFNGVISITGKDIDSDGFNLDDCFRRLKNAVEKECGEWGMRCGRGKNPITVEYQFES